MLRLYCEKGENKQWTSVPFASRPSDREWRLTMNTLEKMGWRPIQLRELYGDDEIVHWDSDDGWYSWESVRIQAARIRDNLR